MATMGHAPYYQQQSGGQYAPQQARPGVGASAGAGAGAGTSSLARYSAQQPSVGGGAVGNAGSGGSAAGRPKKMLTITVRFLERNWYNQLFMLDMPFEKLAGVISSSLSFSNGAHCFLFQNAQYDAQFVLKISNCSLSLLFKISKSQLTLLLSYTFHRINTAM